jgi:hypothetical protein
MFALMRLLDDQLISVLNEKIASMAELKARFAVKQSTLNRAIQRLEARRVVVQFGKARPPAMPAFAARLFCPNRYCRCMLWTNRASRSI